MPIPEFRWLGEVPYKRAQGLQNELIQQLKPKTRHEGENSEGLCGLTQNLPDQGVVLGLEHPPVITLGRRGAEDQDVLGSRDELEQQGFDVITSERGGQGTLHEPGQLVIYPVLSLKAWGLRPKSYVNLLEKVTVNTLNHYGIKVFSKGREPGLFTRRGKLAFFGVRIAQGITSHGVAINITNPIRSFDWIRSCGHSKQTHDRMADWGVDATPKEIFQCWMNAFDQYLQLDRTS